MPAPLEELLGPRPIHGRDPVPDPLGAHPRVSVSRAAAALKTLYQPRGRRALDLGLGYAQRRAQRDLPPVARLPARDRRRVAAERRPGPHPWPERAAPARREVEARKVDRLEAHVPSSCKAIRAFFRGGWKWIRGQQRRFSRRQMLKGAGLMLGSIPGARFSKPAGRAAPAAPAAATTKPRRGASGDDRASRRGAAATTAPAAAAATTARGRRTAATKPVRRGARIIVRDHDWIQGNPGQQGDWYDGFIAKFEEAHPDIKVEREWFPRGEMHAKELALAATGQIGDTVRINLAPLVCRAPAQGRGARSEFAVPERPAVDEQRPEAVLAGQHQDLYPRRQAVGPARGRPPRRGPVLHQPTMVEKAGLKMPPADGNWTFDDMLTLAKGLTKSEGGRTTVYGVIPPVGDTTVNEGMVGFLRAFGGDLFDVDGKQCLLNTPESKAGLKALADLYTSGSAYPWAPDIGEQTPELFQSQKVGMVIQTSFAASSWPGPDRQAPRPVRDGGHPESAGPDRQARHPGLVRRQGVSAWPARIPTKPGSCCRSCIPASATASSASPTAWAARAAASTSGTATSSSRRRPSWPISPR